MADGANQVERAPAGNGTTLPYQVRFNGELLRTKGGIARRFRTETTAQRALDEALADGPRDAEQSISEILADLGVTHERDPKSVSSGEHRLYFAGRFIGHYDAHAVGALIREHLEPAASQVWRAA